MDSHQEITRREALGLFKAMTVLGAGLMVSRNTLSQGQATQKIDMYSWKGIPGEDLYELRFYITSQTYKGGADKPTMFSVKLHPEMVKMLAVDPSANVQAKLWAVHINGDSQPVEWGTAQLKLHQGILQSKGFMVQDKGHSIQDKLRLEQQKVNPAVASPSPIPTLPK